MFGTTLSLLPICIVVCQAETEIVFPVGEEEVFQFYEDSEDVGAEGDGGFQYDDDYDNEDFAGGIEFPSQGDRVEELSLIHI